MRKLKKTMTFHEDVIDMIEQRDLQKYPYENLFIETAIRNFCQHNGEVDSLNLEKEFYRINQKLDRLMEKTESKHADDIFDLNTLR